MQLFYSPTSPYVRKVSVVAIETGQWDRIERIAKVVSPVARDAGVAARNPLGKVPTLITAAGEALYDSRVICEYLDSLHGGAKMFPASGPARFAALTQQALADGLLDAALLVRYEGFMRPEDRRWADWTAGQTTKMTASLDEMNRLAPGLGDRLDIGTISFGCALGYIDFRFGALNWRGTRPALAAWAEKFNARPSMQATVPVG